MEEYDETKDADFNPVYCNDTLSDVESEDEQETEEAPEVIQLKSNACMFKVENMKGMVTPMELIKMVQVTVCTQLLAHP